MIATSTRKFRRRPVPGAISIEQRDDARVLEPLLNVARCAPARSPDCVLVALCNGSPLGALALEIELDSATIVFFFVLEVERRRGLGASLIHAARRAARTRGVTTLYVEAPLAASDFLRKAGFTAAAPAAAGAATAVHSRPFDAWRLDISGDGVILR